MSQYTRSTKPELKAFLSDKGLITQDLLKADLITLAQYFEEGKIKLVTDSYDEDYKNDITDLHNRLSELEEEVNSKTIALERLHTSCENYKILAIEAEDASNQKIKEQEATIRMLKEDLVSRKSSVVLNDIFCDQCCDYETKLTNTSKLLEHKTLELNEVSQEMNKVMNKIKDLEYELLTFRQKKVTKHTKTNLALPTNVSNSNMSGKNKRRNKILLLADSQGRQCGSIMAKLFNNMDYSTLSIYKPNGTFENITEDVFNLCKDFTKTDHIIIFGGSNNAVMKQYLSECYLNQLRKILRHTNICLLLTPLWNKNISFNSVILQNNFMLHNTFKDHAKIINTNSILQNKDFTRHGLHINYKGKLKLCKHIVNLLSEQCSNSLSDNTGLNILQTTSSQERRLNIEPSSTSKEQEIVTNLEFFPV